MKLYIDCECPLLQRALELFLKDYIVSFELAEFVISDNKKNSPKPIFLIGEKSPYITLPFSKDRLLHVLKEYCIMIKNHSVKYEENSDIDDFEKYVLKMIDEFKNEVLQLIRSQNGK